jgi:hypothetical protein
VAVKVTELPEHIVVLLVAMLNVGITIGLMVIVMAFDVAGLPDTPLRLDVITQVIIDPVTSVVVV